MKITLRFIILFSLALGIGFLWGKWRRNTQQAETLAWQSEPTDSTVFSFTKPGKTEVVLYYENGEWHVLKEDAK